MNKKDNKGRTSGTILTEAYDYSVASRMAGRAGAESVKGGKGIALEVMYSDKSNLRNLFSDGNMSTVFTKSPTAKQVDLVTMKNSKVFERIQCKDTPSTSGIAKTFKQVKSGKYDAAQLVGTSETSSAFNSKAAGSGIKKVMKDSGISTNDTSRISNKFNNISSVTGMGNIVFSAAKTGGAISGGIAAIKSIADGDDLETATANITSSALNGAVSSGVGAAASEGTMALLAVAPIPLVAKVAIGIGAGVVAGGVAGEAVSEVCDEIGEVTGVVAEGVGSIAETIADEVGSTAEEFFDTASDAVFDSIDKSVDTTFDAICNTIDFAGDIAEGVGNVVGGFFSLFE